MKKPVTWMAKNHVAANLFMVFVLLSGFLSMMSTKVETFPEFSLDQISVQVPYLGASPAEVEEGVVRRIEERLAGLDGVRRIRSIASEGIGSVTVELKLGADPDKVLDDIKNEVDRIDTFPVETEKPVIREPVRRNQVIDVVLYGAVSEQALKVAAERARNDLRSYEGISQVELNGVRPDEISIEVSETALRAHNLSLGQVQAAVQRASLDLPGGSIKSEGGEILVRTKGLRYNGPEYEQIAVLTRPDGTSLKLGQIATVIDGFEDSDLIARFNGQRAAIVQVFRTGEENAIEIATFARQYVEEQQGQLPAGINIAHARDDSRILRSRLDLLLRNAQLGLLLVFICLSLFMNLRLAFWVMLGIPISFLGSFILIPAMGVSINMLSLFAFIVALGIVVDDAIIVGENIYAHREKGKNFLRAAIDGTLEVGTPVVFSVLTSIVAFMPLMAVEGIMGKFMEVIPVIVVSVLILSLVESLFILPAHLSSKGDGLISRIFGTVFRIPLALHARVASHFDRGLKALINGPYTRTIRGALANPTTTLAIGLTLMLITIGWVAGGRIKFVFMPEIESDWITVSIVMPQGTTAQQTETIVERIENAAERVRSQYDGQRPENAPSVFNSIFTFVGDQPNSRRTNFAATGPASSQGHLAEVTIELLPSEERGVNATELEGRLRQLVGELPGPESLSFSSSLFVGGNPIEMQLASSNFANLLQAVERVKEEVANYPGTGDIQDSFQDGKLEMKLSLKPEARTLGLTMSDLALQVRQGFYGAQALRFQRGRDDVRVMVRYPKDQRRTRADLENMRIRTPTGTEVPFSQVAQVATSPGYASIQRSDGRRVVTVTASVDQDVANADEINRDLENRFLPLLVQDYPGLQYSFEGEQREQAESFSSLGRGYAVAMFAVFALLAIPFRSYTQPLVVMSAIPFGLVGAVWGHVIMDLNLALLSLFGVVALSGVVINDSLVLLSFYNQLRQEGHSEIEALVEAGKQRFRPILLTSLTTFFGLLPMILEKSVQAQFLIPMAVSLGFGIIFATFIILIGVPVCERVRSLLIAKLSGSRQERPDSQPAAVLSA